MACWVLLDAWVASVSEPAAGATNASGIGAEARALDLTPLADPTPR